MIDCDKLICLNCNSLLNECPFCKFNFIEITRIDLNRNLNRIENEINNLNYCEKCHIIINDNKLFCNYCWNDIIKDIIIVDVLVVFFGNFVKILELIFLKNGIEFVLYYFLMLIFLYDSIFNYHEKYMRS